MHVKVGDKVIVIAGKDKGKTGKVLKTLPKKDRVVVEGINIQTRHQKARGPQEPGGIIKAEGAIHVSNVMVYNESLKKGTRVGYKVLEDGKKVRYMKADGETLDKIREVERMASRLETRYKEEIVPQMMEKLGYDNIMQVPKLDKVVINIGLGNAKENPKVLENALRELELITGQKPVVTHAKKSIANFKLREGMKIGCKVTLRRDKMYYFLDKLMNIALPRVRDFRGVSSTSFDGRGNYALGIKEQLIFPEIVYDEVDEVRGMDIIIVTTANTDKEAKEFLELLGMPFRK